MFNESQIDAKLASDYAAAVAAKTYNPNGSNATIDLQAGDHLTALEGACPLKTAEVEGTKRSWPTFTLKIERAGGVVKYIDGVSISNLERGSLIIVDKKPTANQRFAISSLAPRLGRRGSVLTAANGVRYIPQDTELGIVVVDGNAYIATDFQKGKSDVGAKAPKQSNYGYIK